MADLATVIGLFVLSLAGAGAFLAGLAYLIGRLDDIRCRRIDQHVDHRLRERASGMKTCAHWFSERKDWEAMWKHCADAMAAGAYPDAEQARSAARRAWQDMLEQPK